MKNPWDEEPTPLCAPFRGYWATRMVDGKTIYDLACDLERRLRLCQRHLKWVSRCATMAGPAGTKPVFVAEDRMQKIKDLVERMEQDGQIPLE